MSHTWPRGGPADGRAVNGRRQLFRPPAVAPTTAWLTVDSTVPPDPGLVQARMRQRHEELADDGRLRHLDRVTLTAQPGATRDHVALVPAGLPAIPPRGAR
jgi:hypothetical protein